MPEYNAGVSDDRSYRSDYRNRQSFSGGYEGVEDSNIQAPPQWSFSDSMCEAGMVFGMMLFYSPPISRGQRSEGLPEPLVVMMDPSTLFSVE